MSIKEILVKIKGGHDIIRPQKERTALVFSGLMILVAFASFGLGRLSVIEERKTPVVIEGAKLSAQVVQEEDALADNLNGTLVASRNSNKYHFPWCSGATRISEANKIWFSSVEEARAKGYTPASNCKGLR